MPLFGRPDTTPTIHYYDNFGAIGLASNSNSGQGLNAVAFNTLIVQPMSPHNELFPGRMTASTALMNMSWASFTNTNSAASTGAWTSSMMLGIYTVVNSTQLSLLNSGQFTTTAAATSNNSTRFTGAGPRWVTIHSSAWSSEPTFSEARYYYGVLQRSSGISIPASSVGAWMLGNMQRFGTFGTSNVTNTTMGHFPFMGIHGTSQTSMPVSIGADQINKVNASANFIPHLVLNARYSAL